MLQNCFHLLIPLLLPPLPCKYLFIGHVMYTQYRWVHIWGHSRFLWSQSCHDGIYCALPILFAHVSFQLIFCVHIVKSIVGGVSTVFFSLFEHTLTYYHTFWVFCNDISDMSWDLFLHCTLEMLRFHVCFPSLFPIKIFSHLFYRIEQNLKDVW